MGLNTIHGKSKDLMTLFDITQNRYFRAELIQNDSVRDYAVANGIDFLKVKYVIKINGINPIKLKDKIKIGNNIFQAIGLQPKVDNLEQFRKRIDMDNFTGETVVYLE